MQPQFKVDKERSGAWIGDALSIKMPTRDGLGANQKRKDSYPIPPAKNTVHYLHILLFHIIHIIHIIVPIDHGIERLFDRGQFDYFKWFEMGNELIHHMLGVIRFSHKHGDFVYADLMLAAAGKSTLG
jgi:hypothetical protein